MGGMAIAQELAHLLQKNFMLQDTKLIALTGSITGIAAALSMGTSEYLSTKAEQTVKNPLRASIYTGGAYLVTVVLLILPYLVLRNYFVCLGCTPGWGRLDHRPVQLLHLGGQGRAV